MADHKRGDEMENEVAALVLGALDPGEEQEVRAHLQSCPGCREVERRLRQAIAVVPLAAEEATPPPRLRERVLAAAGAPAAEAPPPRRAEPRERARREGRPTLRRPLQVAIAAGLAVLLALAGWNVYLTRQLRQAQNQPRAGTISRQPIAATSAGTIQGASGYVLQVRGQDLTIVSFAHLPPLAQGRVYQLWVGPNAHHVQSAGIFLPEQDGSKVLVLDRSLTHDALIAVTVEPGPDGSSAPTQSPGLVGQL